VRGETFNRAAASGTVKTASSFKLASVPFQDCSEGVRRLILRPQLQVSHKYPGYQMVDSGQLQQAKVPSDLEVERDVEEPPDIYYVLAWNFKREILANNQELIRNGVEFYFPVNPKEH